MGNKRRNHIIMAIVAIVVVVALIATSILILGPVSKVADDRLNILSVNVDKRNILVNDSVNVTVAVKNDGGDRCVKTINLLVDGALIQSKNISLEIGEGKMVSFTVISSSIGNHSLMCGNNSSYFSSYPRWRVGDYQVVKRVWDSEFSTKISNMTILVGAINGPIVTFNTSFDDGITPSISSTNDSGMNASVLLANFTMIEKVVYPTIYGDKLLTHYVRAEVENGTGYHVWMGESSLLVLRKITITRGYHLTEDLIATNMPWVEELARS